MDELAGVADPRVLIPGDPDELDTLRTKLRTFAQGMGGAATKLRAIDAGDWHGHGGNAFRTLIGKQPEKFDTAGTSFQRAQLELAAYSRVLRAAQTDARRAISLHDQGDADSARWNAQVTAYHAAVKQAQQQPGHPASNQPAPVRPAVDNPGAGQLAAAQTLLAGARARVAAQAERLHRVMSDAAADAPKKPGLLHRVVHDVGSALTFSEHAVEGVSAGFSGMAEGLWALTGAAVTNPNQFLASWKGLATLVDVVQPDKMGQAWVAFGKGFTDWDEWATDPGRAFGKTLVNVSALALGAEGLAGGSGELGLAANAGRTGEIADASMLEKVVSGANPKFTKGASFKINCQHCVRATALRLRGVKATARSAPTEVPSMDSFADAVEKSWATTFKPSSRAQIESTLIHEGHGADGVVYVAWKSGSAHVFNAVNVNGKVHFIDGQNGLADASAYFSRAKPGLMEFALLDKGIPSLTTARYVKGLGSNLARHFQPTAVGGPPVDYAHHKTTY